MEQAHGCLLTKTPLLAKRELYKISGHWDHYLDGMFVLGDPHDETKDCFALRPMTCPFQYQAYLNRKRSYRDLPLRYNETSTLFRNEASGEMHGLIRVRQFTISEGHLMCTPEQLEALQQQAAAVYVDDRLYYYAASVSRATREHPQAVLGVSPRGTLALIQSAKAMAMLRGRDYLLPDDIMPLCQDVLAHRILTKGGVAAEQVLDEVLHQVPAPMPDRR